MRSLGRKHEAFNYVWNSLEKELNLPNSENKVFIKPQILDCKEF